MNPYQAPNATLQGAESTRRPPVHRYQRGIAVGWLLVAAVIGCMLAFDAAVVISAGGPPSVVYILMVPLAVYAVASVHFGRMLWQSSNRARRTGTIVSTIGGLLMAIQFVFNLADGLTRSRPAALLTALVCAAGLAFCVVSLRVSRRLV